MGPITAPPVVADQEKTLKQLPASARVHSKIAFTVVLAEGVHVVWHCRLLNNNLYVDVPVNLPLYGSKDRFVLTFNLQLWTVDTYIAR